MISNLSLLLRCYFYALVRGPATRPVKDPKAVCIVQTAQMGDMVCTTPMFRAVKKAYPDCRVYVVGTAINKEVLAGNPDVDGYLVWDHDISKMSQKIRTLSCDFACTTGPNFRGLAVLYLAGVPLIAAPEVVGGWSPTETKSYRLLRRLIVAVPHGFESYAPREYLRLLEALHIKTDDAKKHVYFSHEAKQAVVSQLQGAGINGPFAVIAPGAGNKIKRWPPERWAQVADHIAQRYMPVVIIGAAPDREDVAAVMSQVRESRISNFGEKLSIEELKALIARASLFVSCDTGPLYIAEALDTPTIDLVGPVSEKVQPPNHPPRHVLIVPPRAQAEIFIMNTRVYDAVEVLRQARATSAEEVIAIVDNIV